MQKVALLNLGCARNLVDSETILAKLCSEGFKIYPTLENSDIGIINTCAFIDEAKEESIDAIFQAVYLKKQKKLKYLVVIGCLVQRYSDEIFNEIQEIDAIISPIYYLEISKILKNFKDKRILKVGTPGIKRAFFGKRYPLVSSVFAYLKISDGCNNKCSYCVIPSIRGNLICRDMDSILVELKNIFKKLPLLKEVNIIGQDITAYKYKKYGLVDLLKKIEEFHFIKWIRLLYMHPDHISCNLLDEINRNSKVCKYLDIPIQHINDRLLKLMNRKTTKSKIIKLLTDIRDKIPEVAIRTTVMVGFPGESHKDFKELMKFIENFRFDKLGVFMYSKEKSTSAYSLPGHVDKKEKFKRFNAIMKLQKEISEDNLKKFLNKKIDVLIEEKSHNGYIGRTEFDAPEVDGQVWVKGKKINIGDIKKVHINDTYEYDLVGYV